MSYLGYQVADLDSCEEELRKWLDQHTDDLLQISTKTPVSWGWTTGFRGDTDDLENFDFSDCKCFESSEDSCSFTTINCAYKIKVVDQLEDKFGNTASYEDAPSCTWLNFQDDSGDYPNETIEDFEFEFNGDVFGLKENLEDFVKWVDNLQNDDPLSELVGQIHEEVLCNGTSCSWYYTTVKDQESLIKLFEYWIFLR